MWIAIITGCLVLAALWAWLETKHRAVVKERERKLGVALDRQDELRRSLGYRNEATHGTSLS